MNYLAHIYLADITKTSLTGSFLGDFAKGPLQQLQLSEAFKVGVNLHRKVDVFTDAHRVVEKSRNRISKERRRFAGIIVDLAYDHFLAINWEKYASCSLKKLTESFYRELQENQSILPLASQNIVPHLIEGNWLENYQTLAGIEFGLNGLSRRYRKRFGRENNLHGAIVEVELSFEELEADFCEFFPELVEYAHKVVSE